MSRWVHIGKARLRQGGANAACLGAASVRMRTSTAWLPYHTSSTSHSCRTVVLPCAATHHVWPPPRRAVNGAPSRALCTGSSRHDESQGPSSDPPRLQLSRESKLQLGILLGSGFVIQMAVGMIIPVLPLFASSAGLGSSGVGLIIAMPAAAKLLLNLPVGHLVDTIGRKPPLIAGVVIDGIGSLCTAYASSLGQMVPARLIVGAGSACGTTAGGAYTMDVVGRYPAHIGLLLGVAQAAGTLGFAAGPAIGGMLADRGGPHLPFVLIGTALIASAPIFNLLPETRRVAAAHGGGGGGGGVNQSDMRASIGQSLASFRALLADDTQRALLLMRFALHAGWSVSLTAVPLHAAATWGATPGQIGHIYSIVTLAGLATAPIAGHLTDRLGRRPMVAFGSVSTALSIACLPVFGTAQLEYYALMGVWAVGETCLMTATSALAADVTPPEQRGAQNSLGNQAGDLTFLVMPVILGGIAQHSHAAAFGLTSALCLGANAGFWRLSRTTKAG